MKLKKVLSWALALALSASLAAPALAAETFTDVQPGAWYYDYVTQCVSRGLMGGMGGGIFSPDSQMTAAQFITVAVNASYPDTLARHSAGYNWWDKAYFAALEHGLITINEYPNTSDVMNAPITRKEMARIASRVTAVKGEAAQTLSSTALIADYSSIGGTYISYVTDCFAKGILAGVDSKGTFNPDGVLTRAEACTVALKLADTTARTPNAGAIAAASEAQTWVEGQTHALAKAGDIVIRSDGKRVVLEETTLTITSGLDGSTRALNILGLYQNVDYVTGWGNAAVGKRSPDGSVYIKDTLSNTVLTATQWKNVLASNELNPRGKFVGSYDGEVYNIYFRWDSEAFGGGWVWIGPPW